MSLILDALRKMEQERRAKRHDSAAIRSEVLNYRGNVSAVSRPKALPLSIAVSALLAAAAGGYFFTAAKEPVPPRVATVSQVKRPVNEPAAMPPVPAPQPAAQSVASSAISTPERTRKESRSMASPPGKAAQAAVPQKNGDNGITLSGIAWQDERYLRRAVINGFLMEEGAEVQGAKIVEIMENRVKFKKGGDLFEVVHNAATVR